MQCAKCGHGFVTEEERLSRVPTEGGEAHFRCAYPNGNPTETIFIPSADFRKLCLVAPDLARYFDIGTF